MQMNKNATWSGDIRNILFRWGGMEVVTSRRKLSVRTGDVAAHLVVVRSRSKRGQDFLGFYVEDQHVLSRATKGIIGKDQHVLSRIGAIVLKLFGETKDGGIYRKWLRRTTGRRSTIAWEVATRHLTTEWEVLMK